MGRIRTKTLRWTLIILVFASLSLLIGGMALAMQEEHANSPEGVEEGAHGEEHGVDRAGDLIDLLGRFINFTIMVTLLIVVAKKFGVKETLIARIDEIRQRLEDLKKEKEETESRYREAEKKLRDFEEERQEIIEQFKREGEAEKERIITEAEQRSVQILKQAEFTIQQEMKSAKDRLRQGVVELAAQRAGEIMAEKMTDKDQDRLVNEFIEKVGNIH